MRGRWWLYGLISIAVLIPCVWQAHIQAGDLASHIYNAWLAQRIHQGAPLGLTIIPQTTNVLFDVILEKLLAAFGADAAQLIAVGAAVLIFVSGAFAFVRRLAGRNAWEFLPAIAMLAYGWVFRMGLFNFYLSLGLSLWALALAWGRTRRGLAAAAALLAVAYTAHALPVGWAIAIFVYRFLAEAMPAGKRRLLPLAALIGIVAASAVLQLVVGARWVQAQLTSAIGVHSFWAYGSRYLAVGWAMAAVWVFLAAMWVRSKGVRAASEDITLQITVLTVFGILVLPSIIRVASTGHVFAYMGERMSLALGVLLCAQAARSSSGRYVRYAPAAIAVVFFAFLWSDEARLNALEDEMAVVVSQLPPGQRVLNALQMPDVATIPVTHIIDRVCVERCYSYGNYEPSSGQFRIRAAGASPVVVTSDADANAILFGTYVVRPADLPLYQVVLRANGRLGVRALPAGQMTRIEMWPEK